MLFCLLGVLAVSGLTFLEDKIKWRVQTIVVAQILSAFTALANTFTNAAKRENAPNTTSLPSRGVHARHCKLVLFITVVPASQAENQKKQCHSEKQPEPERNTRHLQQYNQQPAHT